MGVVWTIPVILVDSAAIVNVVSGCWLFGPNTVVSLVSIATLAAKIPNTVRRHEAAITLTPMPIAFSLPSAVFLPAIFSLHTWDHPPPRLEGDWVGQSMRSLPRNGWVSWAYILMRRNKRDNYTIWYLELVRIIHKCMNRNWRVVVNWRGVEAWLMGLSLTLNSWR